MTTYFLRRLLLVPVTFLAITLLVYSVLRVVPGGPIEQAEASLRMAAMSGEAGGRGAGLGEQTELQLDEEAMRDLTEYYSLDRPILVGYLQWLGAWSRPFRSRVPPVPVEGNEQTLARLKGLKATADEAQVRIDAHLAKGPLVAHAGRVHEVVPPEQVDEAVRREAARLDRTTFGDRAPVVEYLSPRGLAHDGGRFLRPVEPDADTAALLAALLAAEKALRAAVDETGYELTEEGALTQTAFAPLRKLNEVEQQARARLDKHLSSQKLIELSGELYQQIPVEELAALKKGDPEFFDLAEEWIGQGYAKRDDLVSHLRGRGYTWRDGHYHRHVESVTVEGDPDYLSVARALISAVDVAGSKLQEVEREQGFRIVPDGRIYRIQERFSGILQLDFGRSYTRGDDVLGMIVSKFEISIPFGLTGYLLAWLICVPLGVAKALRHRTFFDSTTSAVVFLGYAIPGFVVALLLMAHVAVHVGLPLGGHKPEGIESMGFLEAAWGRFRHMLIPVTAYTLGSFATMTILMKNSLLENLGQDYVRTAFAKGLRERRVIFVHALRNSLIPITATVGHALAILLAGSFLIEKTCNIPGMGLLGYMAIVERDYPITMGVLVFIVLIQLFGNIISDLVWALIDPRIRYGR